MALQPEVLILDEPTSQLDPIAASGFLSTLGRIHRDLGTTVILTEHRLDEVIPMADRLLILDGGRVWQMGPPGGLFHPAGDGAPYALLHAPRPCRFGAVSPARSLPADAQQWAAVSGAMGRGSTRSNRSPPGLAPAGEGKTPWVVAQDVWFRYESGSPDILRGV